MIISVKQLPTKGLIREREEPVKGLISNSLEEAILKQELLVSVIGNLVTPHPNVDIQRSGQLEKRISGI